MSLGSHSADAPAIIYVGYYTLSSLLDHQKHRRLSHRASVRTPKWHDTSFTDDYRVIFKLVMIGLHGGDRAGHRPFAKFMF
jgi:hypothetical protein